MDGVNPMCRWLLGLAVVAAVTTSGRQAVSGNPEVAERRVGEKDATQLSLSIGYAAE